MLIFHYSEDLGLLDRRAKKFRREHPNLASARNPNPGELHMFLTQGSLIQEYESYLIEGYMGSVEMLPEIFGAINLRKNILLLIHTDPGAKFPQKFLDLCGNKDHRLEPLNERTKRSYVDSLLKENKIRLPAELSKLLKDSLPAKATEINDFITKLSCLDAPRLNEQNLKELLGDIKVKVDYFSFIYLYLKDDLQEWMLFYILNVTCEETHRKLYHAFIYKLMDLKRFLALRRRHSDLKKIASKMKTQYYFLFEFEGIWKRYGEHLCSWLSEFIISLYSFTVQQIRNRSSNPDLFRFFLLQNHIKLLKVD